jgi:hypothetical protein
VPVYADGVVYVAFYQPNMDIAPVSPGSWADRWFGESLQEYAREKKLIPAEVQAIEDHWRKIGEDVIVAMDARTGETLWRTIWPRRVYNLQTHKLRGTFGVPLIAGGRVFYPNFQNALEVMDANTGEPLWEFPKFEGPPQTKWRPSGPAQHDTFLSHGVCHTSVRPLLSEKMRLLSIFSLCRRPSVKARVIVPSVKCHVPFLVPTLNVPS